MVISQGKLGYTTITTKDGVTYPLYEVEEQALDKMFKLRNPLTKEIYGAMYAQENNEKTLFKQYIEEMCGEFYFLLSNDLIKKDNLFRYTYLLTKADAHGYVKLTDDITKTKKTKVDSNGERVYTEHRYCKKSDLKYIFNNISRNRLGECISYFFNNEMIEEDKETKYIKIPNKYYMRYLNINQKKIKENGGVRMFDNAINEIYSKATPKEHGKIDILIKLLPYVNYKYNIVCKNINEENKENIERFSPTELSKMFGYKAVRDFKNTIFDLKIGGVSVIAVVKVNRLEMVAINPKFYYKGNDLDGVQWIAKALEFADEMQK